MRASLVPAALQKLRGTSELSAELEEMLAEQAAVKGQRAKNPWELFQNPALRWQLVSIVVLSSAMQLCGNDSVRAVPGTCLGPLGLDILAAGGEQIVSLPVEISNVRCLVPKTHHCSMGTFRRMLSE